MDGGKRWGMWVVGGGAKVDALVLGHTWEGIYLAGVWSGDDLLYARHQNSPDQPKHTWIYSIPHPQLSPSPDFLYSPFLPRRIHTSNEYDDVSRNFFARFLAADALRRGESVPERARTIHLCLAEPRWSPLVLALDHDRRLLA